jgi:hypothetical protein
MKCDERTLLADLPERTGVERFRPRRKRDLGDSFMKCLSIQQPWAWAVCAGEKTVENKTWWTDYRGPLVIHAGQKKQNLQELLKKGKGKVQAEWFSLGALIGTAELVDVVQMHQGLEGNTSAFGPICWILEKPRLFRLPVPAKGQLQLVGRPGRPSPQATLRGAVPRSARPNCRLLASTQVGALGRVPEPGRDIP